MFSLDLSRICYQLPEILFPMPKMIDVCGIEMVRFPVNLLAVSARKEIELQTYEKIRNNYLTKVGFVSHDDENLHSQR